MIKIRLIWIQYNYHLIPYGIQPQSLLDFIFDKDRLHSFKKVVIWMYQPFLYKKYVIIPSLHDRMKGRLVKLKNLFKFIWNQF